MQGKGTVTSVVRKSIFRKIFLLMLVPVVCFFVSALFTYYYYARMFENEVREGYGNALESIAANTNNIIYEIYKTNILLGIDRNMTGVTNSDIPLPKEEFYRISGCIDTLKVFRSTKAMIENAYIIQEPMDLVISCDGAVSIDRFFSMYYRYEQYPKVFWLGLKLKSGEFRLLEPSRVENTLYPQKSKRVLPIVQSGTGNSYSRNLFVVNVDQDMLGEMLDSYKMTPNSVLLVTDGEGKLFASSAGSTQAESSGLLELIRQKMTGLQEYEGQKYLIITRSAKVMSKEFEYSACVPMHDLAEKTAYIKNSSYAISILALLLTTLIAFILARRIYSPIKNLVSIMSQKAGGASQPAAGDEIEFLNNGIRRIVTNAESLSRDLSFSLPMACEQYLQNILNQSEFVDEAKMEDMLGRGGVTFRHSGFQVILLQLSFTKTFYESFNREEQLMAYSGTVKIIRGLFPEEYQVYIVSSEKDRICIVVNLPEDTQPEQMEEKLKVFYDLYSGDKELLQIFIGIGRIYSGIKGMQISYTEAQSAISMLSPFGRERIRIFTPDMRNVKYLYSLDEENKLYNFLMSGRGSDVESLLNSIIHSNIHNHISDSGMKELYLQLFLTGQRVMNGRNLSAADLMGEGSIDLTSSYIRMNPKEIIDYVAALFSRIVSAAGSERSTIDVSAIKDYIDAHFCEDIYLEKLADQYNTSAAYLSRLLKHALGMSFNQYLSTLRITQAKQLLTNTSKPINLIAQETGFNSRNTFIRMFKKHEGIIPSEYRKNFHK